MDILGIAGSLIPGAVTTLIVATGAWIVGTVLGLVLDIARSIVPRPIAWILDFVMTTLRSVPQLVVLYIFYFGIGAFGIDLGSILSAVLALGLTEAAFTAEYYRSGLLTVPAQQRDAGLSIGLSRFQVFGFVVFPQSLPFLVPPLLNSYVGLLKTSTIAAAVGAPEILYQARTLMSATGQLAQISLTVMLLFLVVTLPLTYAVSRLEVRARSYRRARLA
jgi:His/Glu/Gln/Arg/opine family amino acid ABC transporter permease subunit